MNDSGCHIVDSCKYEWLDKSCESLMEGGGDFSAMAAHSPLGRQVWTDCAVVCSQPLAAVDAGVPVASCLAEVYMVVRQGCRALHAAGKGMWLHMQSPLSVPLCCMKALYCSQPKCHTCAFIPL